MAIEESTLVSAHEDRVHGLLDFLERPILVAEYSWTTSDVFGTPIVTLPFPETIWSQEMWNEKLKGFRYLRADLNFQIQLNGSPFDVGRLWCFWSPFDSERGDRRPSRYLTCTTGYPGVEVDLGNMMTSELTIPYVSMYTHIDQLLGSQPYGIFRVQVMSSFESQTNTSASISIYCWLTNIDLAIPTDTNELGATVPVLLSQSGRGRSVNLNSEQVVRSKSNIISSGSRIVGDAARMFANVPVIGEIAKPVAWLSDVTQGAASMLGFSKPTTIQAVSSFAQIPGRGFTHTDGLDNSTVLGSKQTNEVGSSRAVFGTHEDELSTSYVIGRPNWIQAFRWNTAAPPRQLPLFKIPVHAGICGTEHEEGTNTQLQATHMSYVASMHRFWRGSVSFRLSVVKNAYYSGRLVVVFYPGYKTGQIVNYNSANVSKCPQWIWDIKRDADLQITIPFQSNLQYLRVLMHNNIVVPDSDDLGPDTITGVLAVFVDNPLRAPATVPDHVWTMVWVHGGADMTFAIPDMVRFAPMDTPPALLLPTIATPPFEEEEVVTLRAQMMRVENTFDVNHKQAGMQNPEGSSLLESRPKTSLTPELMCIGEMHNNLRPYTRRLGLIQSVTVLAPNTGITLDPAFFFDALDQVRANPLNFVTRIYAFYRGSMRYKFFITAVTTASAPPDPSSVWVPHQFVGASTSELVSGNPRQLLTVPDSSTRIGSGRMVHYQPIDNNPVFEITCPYYSNVPMQLISKTYVTNLHLRMVYKLWLALNTPDDVLQFFCFKAGGDDFDCGFLIGPPLIQRTGML